MMDLTEEILELAVEAADKLENMEYNFWYNTNTMSSFEEWRSKNTLELINKIRSYAGESCV